VTGDGMNQEWKRRLAKAAIVDPKIKEIEETGLYWVKVRIKGLKLELGVLKGYELQFLLVSRSHQSNPQPVQLEWEPL